MILDPVVLFFLLGVGARLARSDLRLPDALYETLSIYLLLAIGLKGGVALSETSLAAIALPAAATVLIGVITPLTSFAALRKLGGFSRADAAGIAAHYGSVSAVTFIAAQELTKSAGHVPEGFMPTLLALMESPGIHVALALGVLGPATQPALVPVAVTSGGAAIAGAPTPSRPHGTLHEVLTGRTMVLLVGGLVVGALVGTDGFAPVKPFFETGFKGALVLFLLEMGLVAGAKLGDLRAAGGFLVAFAIVAPIVHGVLGVALGTWAGLSVGGATVLGAMAASASYIAAPPAVRLVLPEANPVYSLTAALAVTFPFNLVLGIPLYLVVAQMMA